MSPNVVNPGINLSCVSISFAPIDETFNGRPDVCENIAPIVHVEPGKTSPPFNCVSVPEKSSFSCAICVSSGMISCSNAPPFA